MRLARSLQRYLMSQDIPFDLVEHTYSEGSHNTAKAADIPPKQLAKAVLFRDEDLNYTLAVVPSCNRVRRFTINQIFDRHMEMADPEECDELFPDCLEGAVPPVGQAYHINVIWDDELLQADYLWLESGDHQHLLKIKSEDFVALMQGSLHDHISSDKRYHPPPKTMVQPYSGLGLF